MADFNEAVSTERKRLTAALDGITTKMTALQQEQDGYRRQLKALDAYEATLTGKAVAASTKPRSTRGARSETLLALIAGSNGMTRSQILESVGAKGNKAEEASISNALTNMKKAGKLTLTDGVYAAV